MYGLKTESSFDASHFLTDYHGKCENLHGHRWRVVAYLEVAELQTEGTCKDMVVDFGDFKRELRSLTERLDHHFIIEEGSLAPDTLACLEREGFALFAMPFRTTAENLAKWFFDALAERGLPVAQVDVYETPNNCAYYRADAPAAGVGAAGMPAEATPAAGSDAPESRSDARPEAAGTGEGR